MEKQGRRQDVFQSGAQVAKLAERPLQFLEAGILRFGQ